MPSATRIRLPAAKPSSRISRAEARPGAASDSKAEQDRGAAAARPEAGPAPAFAPGQDERHPDQDRGRQAAPDQRAVEAEPARRLAGQAEQPCRRRTGGRSRPEARPAPARSRPAARAVRRRPPLRLEPDPGQSPAKAAARRARAAASWLIPSARAIAAPPLASTRWRKLGTARASAASTAATAK